MEEYIVESRLNGGLESSDTFYSIVDAKQEINRSISIALLDNYKDVEIKKWVLEYTLHIKINIGDDIFTIQLYKTNPEIEEEIEHFVYQSPLFKYFSIENTRTDITNYKPATFFRINKPIDDREAMLNKAELILLLENLGLQPRITLAGHLYIEGTFKFKQEDISLYRIERIEKKPLPLGL